MLTYIDEHPDEPIRFVGHSHGGNIGILLANMLHSDGIKTETLITIATPVRNEYQLKNGAVNQHINVYNDGDNTQLLGGSSFLLIGAKRTFKGATNIKVPTANKFFGYPSPMPFAAFGDNHSYMHNNIALWNAYIAPQINR